MRRDLLSRFKCSIVFQVNSNPGCPKRMAAHRSGYAGIKRSPADHSVGFRSRHWPPGRPFLVEGLKERLVWLETRAKEKSMTPIKARSRKPCRESIGIESRSVRASSTLKTGVLPRLTTWVGPLTGAAGLVGTIWLTTR